jgi:hypothetical protein
MTLSTASISAMNNTFAAANNDSQKTKSGTFDSMLHGEGSFAKTMQDVNGLKTVDRTITYADGTTKTTERAITINADGSKTSTVEEAMVSNADGSSSVTKVKTKADGSVIQSTATKGSMNGETDTHIVRTNADGQTETLDRTSIKDGHTKSHTTTGTGYDGNPIYNESTWTTTA